MDPWARCRQEDIRQQWSVEMTEAFRAEEVGDTLLFRLPSMCAELCFPAAFWQQEMLRFACAIEVVCCSFLEAVRVMEIAQFCEFYRGEVPLAAMAPLSNAVPSADPHANYLGPLLASQP
ncbi:hypothetical protein T10_8415 [Trichinella papuae]|uniref:Uncharacterized protein n=1 Tax=Trichinella papuae TaxID=268474 RepID=A0A0V1N4E1_9BILA|nr:hypothetical protein T10_8415 [Trichinella papuae]